MYIIFYVLCCLASIQQRQIRYIQQQELYRLSSRFSIKVYLDMFAGISQSTSVVSLELTDLSCNPQSRF